MARLCFLFNHDQTHQIAHSLPIALELARTGEHEIVLAVTHQRIEQRLRTMVAGLPAEETPRITRLGLTRGSSRVLAAGLDGLVPASKILLYRDNLDFFRGFDALVVSEKTSLLLKTRYGLGDLKIIHTRHGAGDRAIGFGKQSADFDLVLVAGEKIRRRLIADAGVDPARIRVTGYAKFDLHGGTRIDRPFADPSLPTVLYNPHPSPRLSSWYRMGESVLEAFSTQDRYNLIFAPHVMMFARRWTVTIAPPAVRRMTPVANRFVNAPNIHVDTGSAASTDMSYTNMADLYMGDVSSQVYEFLYRPRPCLFLDVHQTAWQGDPDYAHWQAGPVIGPDADIIAAVDKAFATHADFLPAQQALLADTFSVTDRPASARAAAAIAEYLAHG